MKSYNLEFTFDPVPPIMMRGRHALIVVQDHEGKFLLGEKDAYPDRIYRFVGGGIDVEEDPQKGAVREIEEELGLKINENDVEPLAYFNAHVSNKKEDFIFETFLYFLNIGDKNVTASDDIQRVVRLTKEEVLDLVERFGELSGEQVMGDPESPKFFRWKDYGTLYGFIHETAMGLVKQ